MAQEQGQKRPNKLEVEEMAIDDLEETGREDGEDGDDEEGDDAEPSFFTDPKRLLQTFAIVLVLVVAIYILLPNLVGLDDATRDARPGERDLGDASGSSSRS